MRSCDVHSSPENLLCEVGGLDETEAARILDVHDDVHVAEWRLFAGRKRSEYANARDGVAVAECIAVCADASSDLAEVTNRGHCGTRIDGVRGGSLGSKRGVGERCGNGARITAESSCGRRDVCKAGGSVASRLPAGNLLLTNAETNAKFPLRYSVDASGGDEMRSDIE